MQSLFSQDSPTNCPIVGYIIETSPNNGTTFVDHPTADPGRYVYLEPDSATARMVIKTDRTMHNEFYIIAFTTAGKHNRQKFEIIVCDDQFSLVNPALKSYITRQIWPDGSWRIVDDFDTYFTHAVDHCPK